MNGPPIGPSGVYTSYQGATRHAVQPPLVKMRACVHAHSRGAGFDARCWQQFSPRARPPAFAFAGSRYRYLLGKQMSCICTLEPPLTVLLLLHVMVVRGGSLGGVWGGGLLGHNRLHIGVFVLCTAAQLELGLQHTDWVSGGVLSTGKNSGGNSHG